MSLRKKIGISILNMGIQRVLDFVSILVVTMLIVRSLSSQEYGMLSVVLSYGLIFNILNVGISSVLLRDYQKIKEQINEYMRAFLMFSIMKGVVVLILSAIIGFFLYRRYHDPTIIAVIAVNAAYTILLYLTEPFATLLAVEFRQSVLTKISLVTSLTNMILSVGAILVPTALFVSGKNAAVALVGLIMAAGYARVLFRLQAVAAGANWFRLVKESFLGFSIWSHLMGIMTDIIYRADLLILGWLGASFRSVGNYNIALQMASFTKLLPQILQYNATLGLSNSNEKRQQEEITFLFLKYSFLLSVVTMAGYLVLGRVAILIIAGRDVDEIYHLGLYIIAGLCIFNTLRPLISYGTVVHNIQECFCYAILPSSLLTLACYVFMGIIRGAEGLAMANLFGGIVMALCTLAYIHERTEFQWRFALVTDVERAVLAKIYAKLRG